MAPYPEEIDVFSAPHSRMKELVDVYSEKLTCTDFKDHVALNSLLHDLHDTFCEFKSHEQIENKLIMRKLKKRLKLLSIHDAAVCNCHSDNKLSDMLALVEDGYSCYSKPEADRINFGQKLQSALQEFTGSFLPHMKEEEEVFQPMLMKYFDYEELKSLKERVIAEHSKWHCYENDKSLLEAVESDKKLDISDASAESPFSQLPPELVSHILSFLPTKDLIRCAEVCHLWYDLSRAPKMWKEIYPCFWSHDIWSDYEENHEDRVTKFYAETSQHHYRDEDADVSDYGDYDNDGSSSGVDFQEASRSYERETKILHSLIKHLLPRIGLGVQKIVLASCRSLTSAMLRSILSLCPNVSYLDISYTSILDSAFKGLKEFSSCLNLRHLDMSGCRNVTDLGLFRLADCMARLPPQVPDGTRHLRDVYLQDCHRSLGYGLDCACEIEDVLLQRRPCCRCRETEFCNSVCVWRRDGFMCHLAKISSQCPYIKSCGTSSASVVKTTGTYLGDATVCSRQDCNLETKSLKYLSLSGCKEVTDDGLQCLLEAGIIEELEFLDLSGCWLLTGPGLVDTVSHLKRLRPEKLSYCDSIVDGPYQETANGCQNLENGDRACCRLLM